MHFEALVEVIERLPEAILLLSGEGIVLAANRRLARLGVDPAGLRGQPLQSVTAEAGETIAEYLRRCSTTAEPVAGSVTLVGSDAAPVPCWVDGSAVVCRSESAEAIVMLRVVPKELSSSQFAVLNQRIEELGKEILRRAELEAELRTQKERLTVTLASIGDAVITTDVAGRVELMNGVAETLCGWARAEAVGRPLNEVFCIINEETRLAVENPVEKVIRHGQIVGLANHTVLVARSGRETPIDDSAAPIVDELGTFLGVVLVFRDVSERRHTELLKERLAAIVESSDDIIVSKNLDGIITSWNRGAERVLGYSAAEVLGAHVSMLMPPDQREDTERILGKIRRGEKVDHYETRRRTKDGRILDVSITVSPIRDAYGHIVGASKIGRDITERKLLETERRAAERRKDEFLAMLAHELRNPLSSISSAVQLFGKLATEEELEWTKDVIQRQVKHLAGLVDDLLDVSRITRGKIGLRKEPLSLAAVVSSAVEVVRSLVDERKHELSVSLAPAVRLDADPLRLEQVIVNLLSNAAKYTEAGGRIGLAARRENDEVVIKVWDTGMGISQELLPHVFDLFVQGDRTIARSEGGLGIGLTLVRGLVEMHGGTVTVSSEGPGRGSEFTVRLPALPSDAEPVERAPRSGLTGGRPPSRVLVVDDNADTARAMSKLLRLHGHEVKTAYDGPTALELGRSYQPEIMLLDIGLPGMDGYEVVRRLREEDCCKDALIIAISGYGRDEDRRRSREAGFDRHLVKPVDYDALIDLLADAAGRARQA